MWSIAAGHQTCKASSPTLPILLFPYYILHAWRSTLTCSRTLKTGSWATLVAAPSLSSGISPLVLDWSMGLFSYCALRFSSWILSLTSWPQSSGSQLWLVFLINLRSAQLSSMLDPNLWNHLLIPDHALILSFWLGDCSCTALAQLPQESWEYRLDYAISLQLFAPTYEGLKAIL